MNGRGGIVPAVWVYTRGRRDLHGMVRSGRGRHHPSFPFSFRYETKQLYRTKQVYKGSVCVGRGALLWTTEAEACFIHYNIISISCMLWVSSAVYGCLDINSIRTHGAVIGPDSLYCIYLLMVKMQVFFIIDHAVSSTQDLNCLLRTARIS